jgi:hypothetical protein
MMAARTLSPLTVLGTDTGDGGGDVTGVVTTTEDCGGVTGVTVC